MRVRPPLIPFPIAAAVVIVAVAYFDRMRTSCRAVLVGAGGSNALAISSAAGY
jgi:ribose transport system permease protein